MSDRLAETAQRLAALLPPSSPRPPHPRAAEVVALWRDGLSYDRIKAAAHVCSDSITTILKAAVTDEDRTQRQQRMQMKPRVCDAGPRDKCCCCEILLAQSGGTGFRAWAYVMACAWCSQQDRCEHRAEHGIMCPRCVSEYIGEIR